MIAEAIPREITLEEIPLELIDIGTNVRADPGELEEMASSIRELGVLQPVKVHGPLLNGHYVLLWGQRRVLASRLAEQITIPAIVMGFTEDKADRPIEQLVENLQRADLNPIEEATALREVLAGDRKLTQAVLATKLGRSQAWIANTLGLLKAPEVIRTAIAEGKLTASHAKAVSGLAPKEQERLARNAIEQGYSAHQLERDAKYVGERQRDLDRRSKETDAAAKRAIAALEQAKIAGDVDVTITGAWNRDPGWDGHEDLDGRAIAATWTPIGSGRPSRRRASLCPEAWGVPRPKITPTCISDPHREAAHQADRALHDAKAAEVAKDEAAIAKAIKVALKAQPPHPTIARLLLRSMDPYGSTTWTDYAKLTDAAAVDELATKLGSRLGTSYGKELPAKSVLASLGATVKP